MKFKQQDLKIAKNLAVVLRKAKFENLTMDEILVISQCASWIGDLLGDIETELKPEDPKPVQVAIKKTKKKTKKAK